LGKAQLIESAQIKWPNGLVQEIGPLQVNQLYEFVEPSP